MRFGVVVPAFNSEAWIEDTLTALSDSIQQAAECGSPLHDALDGRIFVVDDGSVDRTPICARRAATACAIPIDVEVLPSNAGQLAATRHGVATARRWGADWIATLDDDALVSKEFFTAILKARRPQWAGYIVWTSSSRWKRWTSSAIRGLTRPLAPVADASAARLFPVGLFDESDPSIDVALLRAATTSGRLPMTISRHPAASSRYSLRTSAAHLGVVVRSALAAT
ncbi:glycosyltransferase family 2 protein [Candidatus Microthrix parvicella]|uniref:glycosyltransferase family 2 protein n=1 Tax=Candidatus Neomicrothrix parvicella TaxID=41950 RepID=UPI0009D9DE4D|nr:glycosyltransferase [Candidatus Microthrix parvicella]